jgi:hypothetical protein
LVAKATHGYWGYDDIRTRNIIGNHAHARGILAWTRIDADNIKSTRLNGFWFTSSCPMSPSQDQLWWSHNCHRKGQNAQCISIASDIDQKSLHSQRLTITETGLVMQPISDFPQAPPTDVFDLIALHLLFRGAAESRYHSSNFRLPKWMVHLNYLMTRHPKSALDWTEPELGDALPYFHQSVRYMSQGLYSIITSTDNDGSSVKQHHLISKASDKRADLYQEMVAPVIKQVATQTDELEQPGGWTWFAYHGGYVKNHHACCFKGSTCGGKDVGCGVRCRPAAIHALGKKMLKWLKRTFCWPGVAQFKCGAPINEDSDEMPAGLRYVIDDIATLGMIRPASVEKFTDDPFFPKEAEDKANALEALKEQMEKLFLNANSNEYLCGDSLVNGHIISATTGQHWWSGVISPFVYSIATSSDHSKGMFSDNGGWICHGDLNREGGRKEGEGHPSNFWSGNNLRGGGAICAPVQDVNDVWNELIQPDYRYRCIPPADEKSLATPASPEVTAKSLLPKKDSKNEAHDGQLQRYKPRYPMRHARQLQAFGFDVPSSVMNFDGSSSGSGSDGHDDDESNDDNSDIVLVPDESDSGAIDFNDQAQISISTSTRSTLMDPLTTMCTNKCFEEDNEDESCVDLCN